MRSLMPTARRLDEAREGLVRDMAAAIESRRRRIELASRELAATSPEAVLARGFAVVRKTGESRAIRDAKTLAADDALDIVFSRGAASARVWEVKP